MKITPTSKQESFIFATERFSCYSGAFGCVGGETRIFNPVTGKSKRIDEIEETDVFALDKGKGILARATCPKIYRKTRLYRVAVASGRSIVVTKRHKFLGEDGLWHPVSFFESANVRVLVYGGVEWRIIYGVLKRLLLSFLSLLRTIWDIFPSALLSSGRSFWRKVADFLFRYRVYSHFYGVQSLLGVASALNSVPLQVYVHEHIPHSLQRDDLVQEQVYILPYQSSTHHDKSHSFLLLDRPAGKMAQFRSVLQVSGQPYGFFQSFSLFQYVRILLQKVHEWRRGFWMSLLTWYYNHTLRYEQLSSIKYERTDYYYDLHVPEHNNYFAEGFVNHNSGKTMAGCLKSLILSSHPANFGLIGRQTYVELRDSTRKTFFEVCPPQYYDEREGGRWSPTENHLRLVNGSEIIFRHLDTIAEKELLSINLGWFFIDQAEEISLPVWRVLQSRLRLNTVPRRYGFIACNPEPGTWIYDVFKRPYDERKLKKDYYYIESTSYDNPHLPPEYIESLIASYPEELQKRYIMGRWDVFEGQILKEFDREVHVVKPFAIPDNWEKIVALDHGMVAPTGVLWGAIDFDGNCVAPETKLLNNDLTWVKAGEVKVGDVLIGFDEKVPITRKRRWREARVESVKRFIKPSYKLTLTDGKEIVCSADHQWLIETLGCRKIWKSTEELRPEWKLLKILPTWETDVSYGAGYLAGAFDGEGSFGVNQRGTMRLSFVQRKNQMMEKVIKELDKRGFRNGNYKRLSSNCNIVSLTRKRDILRFMGSIRPKRLLPKFKISEMKGFSAFEYPTIVKKEFLGRKEVMAIQTSTRTYIAEGLASHNCYIYDEYYSPGLVSEHARSIHEKTGTQEIALWVIDPSTQAKTREKDNKMWSVIEEYEDYGLYFTPANNEKLAGINRVREFLNVDPKRLNPRTGKKGSPRLFIFQNCVNLLWEIPQYQWKRWRSTVQKNPREEARDFNDHLIDACFKEDTLVITNQGEKKIKDIKIGDHVWSPFGFRKVQWSGRTGEKEVFEITLSNGFSLIGTGNHKIWNGDKFVTIDSLKYADIIEIWEIRSSSIVIDTTKNYIQIKNSYPYGSSILQLYGHWQQNGINRKQEKNGINSTDHYAPKRDFSKTTFANFVKENSNLKLQHLAFVPLFVGLLGDDRLKWMTKSVRVWFATKITKLTNTLKQKPVVGNVLVVSKVKLKRKYPVYNLQVEGGMYCINGIYVSNCRYLVMARFPPPLKKPYGDSLIMPADRQNANLVSAPMQIAPDPELGSFETNREVGEESSVFE